MAMMDLDPEREKRITMEIIVDIYEEDELALGWYYYLEQTLNFPFPAQWKMSSKKARVDSVEVVGMASEEECESEMVCEVAFEGDVFSAPLMNLSAPDADDKTQEAIADWHYWVNRGNGLHETIRSEQD